MLRCQAARATSRAGHVGRERSDKQLLSRTESGVYFRPYGNRPGNPDEMKHARHRYSRISALARLRRAGVLLAAIALTGVFVARAEAWRSVQGIVRDRSGQLLGGSVVQIENMLTLDVRSYIVKSDGKYHFMRLRPDIDYTLRARYRNVWGVKKKLSAFDSRKNAEVALTVDVVKEE